MYITSLHTSPWLKIVSCAGNSAIRLSTPAESRKSWATAAFFAFFTSLALGGEKSVAHKVSPREARLAVPVAFMSHLRALLILGITFRVMYRRSPPHVS